MAKSADAFRTISEAADEVGTPQHVLRFWETRFPQIKPMKRGGGRRYYRPEDVALLKGIRRLLYGEGYTIKGLQRILREQGPRHVQAIGRGAPIGAMGGAAVPVAGPGSPAAVPNDLADGAAERREPYRQPVPEGLDDVSVLTAVMKELGECRRILEQALQPAPDAA